MNSTTAPQPTTNRRRMRLLAQMGLLLGAAAVTIGAGADFTTRTANPTNTFTSGVLDHSNSADNEAILTAAAMWPGQIVDGEVTIENTGDLVGNFTLDEVDVTSDFRADTLELVVQDTTNNAEVWAGDLGSLGSVDLGAFQPDEVRTYSFTVTFSEDAENDLDEGKSAVVTYQWNETPARVAAG
jgi:spore coat-associated protein N